MAYDFNSLTKQADEASNRDKFYTDFEDVDPNILHQITELTEWMRTKAKGSDVREVIAQLFERTWVEAIKEGNTNLEVAKARGGFSTLGNRLKDMTTRIGGIAEGSPKGVYANLSALQAAKPNGDSGIYVTADSGHWYYYNNGWKDGGVYQAKAELSSIKMQNVVDNTIDYGSLQGWNGLTFKLNQDGTITTTSANTMNSGLIFRVPDNVKYLNLNFLEKNSEMVQLYEYKSSSEMIFLSTLNITTGATFTYDLQKGARYLLVLRGASLSNTFSLTANNSKSVNLRDSIENIDTSIENVKNSFDPSHIIDKEVLGTQLNLSHSVAFGESTRTFDGITLSVNVTGNNGGVIIPSTSVYSERVVVYTDLTFTQKAIKVQISYIDKTDNQRKYKTLKTFTGGKATRFEFDASNLIIYSNAEPSSFKFLIQSSFDSAPDNNPVGTITLKNISVFDAGGTVASNPMYDPNLKLTLGNIIAEVTKLNSSLTELENKGSYVTMPDGSEGKLVYVNGVVTVKSSNYNKVLLLGNSLLLGLNTDGSHGAPFGMTASDSKHDWAYLLTEKLKVKSPSVTVKKLHDAKFEQAESDSASESYISNEFAAADKNNDLVIIQIGDNVNTTLRHQTFRNNFSKLIRAIRTNNPTADIIVAGAWFNGGGIESWLQSQAKPLNYTFVPLSDLCTSANMATVGDTITFDDGTQTTVTSTIRTHPGNKGMQAIANRIYDSLN